MLVYKTEIPYLYPPIPTQIIGIIMNKEIRSLDFLGAFDKKTAAKIDIATRTK